MVRVKVENLRKEFEDEVAVDDISFEVDEGVLFVLLGPSGCGKSTTLRMIAGLEEVTSGEIFFDDGNIVGVPPSERNIAMVFQDLALYPHLTARENMSLSLKEKGMEEDKVKEKVEDTLELLQIPELADRHPGQLSGGQKQRAALGRALVRDPDVLLMDEPLAALDAKLRSKMRSELIDLQEEVQTTTLYVTHNQEEAIEVADEIAVMSPDGKIVQQDASMKIYDDPKNLYVASFIGRPEMNFWEGEWEEENGNYYYVNGNFKFDISHLSDSEVGPKLTLGVRPQDFSLHCEEPDELSFFGGTIDTVRKRGKDDIIEINDSLGGQTKVIVDSDEEYSEGQNIYIGFDAKDAVVFDSSDGGINLSYQGDNLNE